MLYRRTDPDHPNIRVAILEDQQLAIDGYSFHLQGALGFQLVGIVSVYSDWEPLLAASQPDVALMDVKVPTALDNPNPYPILHVMPQLVQAYPETAFLVISAYPEPTLIQGVIEAGASGYVLKDDNVLLRELNEVLRSVASGHGLYLSPQAKQQMLQRLPPQAETGLTPRQLEALSLCAAYPDCSIKDLAAQMRIANSTVRNLLSQAYLRLGVSNRLAAVLKAQHLGLITPLAPPAESHLAKPQSP